MSLISVKAYLQDFNRFDIMEFKQSSATVEEAASTIGVNPDVIAKTVAFYDESQEHALIIVTSGLAKISSGKFKRQFGFKPHMIAFDQVEDYTGHQPGGVCPFANPHGAKIYLDVSLKRYPWVYPACGSSNSAIKVTIEELETYVCNLQWVDLAQTDNN